MLKYAIILLFLLSASSVQARPIPESQWTVETRLYAAQACYAEAGFYETDCGEILWVLATRWQRVQKAKYRDPNSREIRLWQFSDMIREYVSALSPYQGFVEKLDLRPKEIRRFPWGNLESTPKHILIFSPKALVERFNARWTALRRLVGEWADGRVEQVCPGADHWGAPNGKDIARARRAQSQGKWVKVNCSKETKNKFWKSIQRAPRLIAYR